MASKTNINWHNKNLIIVTDDGSIIDVFQNSIYTAGETTINLIYTIINIFNNNNISKIECGEKNNQNELFLDKNIIGQDHQNYKMLLDFVNYCKYLINNNNGTQNTEIDDDNKLLFNKKYEKIKILL